VTAGLPVTPLYVRQIISDIDLALVLLIVRLVAFFVVLIK